MSTTSKQLPRAGPATPGLARVTRAGRAEDLGQHVGHALAGLVMPVEIRGGVNETEGLHRGEHLRAACSACAYSWPNR